MPKMPVIRKCWHLKYFSTLENADQKKWLFLARYKLQMSLVLAVYRKKTFPIIFSCEIFLSRLAEKPADCSLDSGTSCLQPTKIKAIKSCLKY